MLSLLLAACSPFGARCGGTCAIATPLPSLDALEQATLYVGTAASYLYALRASDGQLRWQYQGATWVTLDRQNSMVVFATSRDGTVLALRAKDGEVLWRTQLVQLPNQGIQSMPLFDQGSLYVAVGGFNGVFDGSVMALNATDGSIRWRYAVGAQGMSALALADGALYLDTSYATDTGTMSSLIALRATDGVLLHHIPLAGSIPAAEGLTVDGEVIYAHVRGPAALDGDSILAVRVSDGHVLWHIQKRDGTLTRPVLSQGVVYFGSSDHLISAVHAQDGSGLWRTQIGGGVSVTIVPEGKQLYVGSQDGFLYTLDASTGVEEHRYRVDANAFPYPQYDTFWSPPIAHQGVIYSSARAAAPGRYGRGIDVSDHIYALNAADGQIRWKYNTRGAVQSVQLTPS